MRASHQSLQTISLLWGGACLSQVYCAPVSHDGIASGSDVQLAKFRQRDKTSEPEAKSTRVSTSTPKEPIEIDIPVPSATNGDQNNPPNDDDNMYRFYFEMYMELLKWIGTGALWLWEHVLIYAIFLALTTILGLGLVAVVVGCFLPTRRTRFH